MTLHLEIPWKKYGIIAELAQKLKGRCPQFGKTALQKLVYLLQEVYEIDCGYEYSLYTYGPYTQQLQQDLDAVEGFKGIILARVVGGTGGYCILPGDKCEDVRQKAADFLNDQKVKGAIDQLVADFGGYWAKELELRSTIVYVERDFRKDGRAPASTDLLQTVHEIKPKFAQNEIQSAISELESKGFINLSS